MNARHNRFLDFTRRQLLAQAWTFIERLEAKGRKTTPEERRALVQDVTDFIRATSAYWRDYSPGEPGYGPSLFDTTVVDPYLAAYRLAERDLRVRYLTEAAELVIGSPEGVRDWMSNHMANGRRPYDLAQRDEAGLKEALEALDRVREEHGIKGRVLRR